jgi:two-component system phosphate regulon sensor histidine kinase PhoR
MYARLAEWFQRNVPTLLAWLAVVLIALAFDLDATLIGIISLPILLLLMVPRGREPAPVLVAPIVVPESDPLAEVKAAFAGFDSPAYLLDPEGSVLYQNKSAVDAFGRFQIGQHLSSLIRLPAVLDMVRGVLATGLSGQTEYSGGLKADSVYQVRMIHASDETVGADFYVLIFRDVSEARRIDRMRTDFVANASHELRTPLASLRGFIETLQGPARNDLKAQDKFLPIMLEQVTRMSRLVDDLMSLSRLELKARVAPDEEVALAPLLGSVCDALQPLARELGVTIERQLGDATSFVRGDRDELTQVFENLIENACKYGQEGERVIVSLGTSASGDPEVSVTDFGPGIEPQHVPRLTERFYRANIESSRSKKGTGLGLAIVKHILTRHKARLAIRSEVGKGSTFTVYF